MLGIHAKYFPWTITNSTRVDAKREFSISGHCEVKGKKKVHFIQNTYRNMQCGMFSLNNCINFNIRATVLL